MELKKAKRVLAEMHKHFTGDWYDALQTLAYYMKEVSEITRHGDYGPEGFGRYEIMKDLHDCWPEDSR